MKRLILIILVLGLLSCDKQEEVVPNITQDDKCPCGPVEPGWDLKTNI